MPLVQQIPRIFSDTPRPVVDARLKGPALQGTAMIGSNCGCAGDDWASTRACAKPRHRADHFLDPEADPREDGPRLGDERATLTEFLRRQRLTLQLKCDGLDPAQLGRRAVKPSTMSLLGLMRHMAEVERTWFRRRFAGLDVPKLYQSGEEPDGDFDGAIADQEVVNDAWAAWRVEVAFAEQFASNTDLSFVGRDGAGRPISLRELLVHMIEEYARHNGHADLLRERIDGRIGL
jgi:uncharacterized damage-inducible protein DinB